MTSTAVSVDAPALLAPLDLARKRLELARELVGLVLHDDSGQLGADVSTVREVHALLSAVLPRQRQKTGKRRRHTGSHE